MFLRIEIDQGRGGWELRSEGETSATVEQIIAALPRYAITYPHRAFIDGRLIATAERPHGLRGKVRMVRHDA